MRPGFTLTRFGEQLDHFQIAPGVTMAPLAWTRHDTPLPASAFVWFAPGARIAGDHHADSAEITVVLRGELTDESGTYGPDDVLTAERGTTHSPHTQTGCFLYVIFPDRR
ncbi:cupin domain-containing protein [Streptomyces sp. TR02-1]|uniref:cupin domain-containing protein n=1 Tax=Streptomyces sp. TR02-1 TaxID=3385977 RepID=UPI0039A25F33